MNVVSKNIVFHIILPLIIGLVIYLIARPDTWLVEKLAPIRFYLIEESGDNLSTSWLKKFLTYSGPDFCWGYSITSALFLWKHYSELNNLSYFPLFVFLLILMQESIQLLFAANFTFDILDIVAALSAFFLSFYLNRKYV